MLRFVLCGAGSTGFELGLLVFLLVGLCVGFCFGLLVGRLDPGLVLWRLVVLGQFFVCCVGFVEVVVG